jgi:hypothetical protein
LGHTLQHAISGKPNTAQGVFLPGYDYLLIDVQGRQAVMALGKRQMATTPDGDVTDEYWYSGDKEMLHLRNGRIQKLLGTPTEWRDSRGQPPAWANLQAGQAASPWLRERDEMPHFRYGIQDRINTQAVATAPAGRSLANQPVQWVQDSVVTTDPQGQRWAFEQHFALQNNRVVYSEQCISPQLCLRLSYKPSSAPTPTFKPSP